MDIETTDSRADEIRRIKAIVGDSSAKVLSAMGHPGYGETFALGVLTRWVFNPTRDLHTLCYIVER